MRPLATIQTNGRGPTTTSSMHPTLIHPFLSTLDYFPDRAIESSRRESTPLRHFNDTASRSRRSSHVVTCLHRRWRKNAKEQANRNVISFPFSFLFSSLLLLFSFFSNSRWSVRERVGNSRWRFCFHLDAVDQQRRMDADRWKLGTRRGRFARACATGATSSFWNASRPPPL